MGDKVQQQLREVGSKLETPPSSKDALIKLLKQASTCLSEIDQSPSTSIMESMQPFVDAIVKPELLKHHDRDVKLLVATCACEITRITAPQAPYSDDVLKDIFHLIVGTFTGLSDTGGPSFGRRVFILDTLAKYRSCVVMLDLECEALVNNMFTTFFAVAKDDHRENVLSSMQTIMIVLIEESEDIREDLLLIILSVLGRNRSDISGAARRLAMNVIENCAAKLEPGIKQCLVSLMSGDNRLENAKIDYHEVIYDVYRCAPQILSGVVPYLTGELLSDQLETRLKAVGLVGELFALPNVVITEAFQPIFLEFVKRLTDREVGVRMSVLEYLKSCLLSNPSRAEASQIISALCDRLLDYDENVRKHVVDVICNVACASLDSIPIETVKLVAERLRDKSLLVKKHTMERMVEIFRVYCLKHLDGPVEGNDYNWIPGKILRCFYDRDFRSDMIESALCGSLFPVEFSVKDRVKHWVKIFSIFDKVEVKALEKILEQKQRLQQEMQKYLSLRQIHQDGDAPEIQKKVQFCFRLMSRLFVEPVNAEENFQILDQLKDPNVWRILTNLLDPNTKFHQASLGRSELLKILGEKHRLYDFLSNLSLKCSYLLFNKEHVKELLLEVATHRSAGNALLTQSCMDMLVIISRFSPILIVGCEEELVNLLKDDNEIIKESALNILAKAGGSIREQLSPSSIDLILEGFCLEGSRRQAKYAIHALAAITKDDGLKSLSVLYKRLVDMLEERRHLPSVLQSLGCIAETAMPVFETRESEIQDFIKNKILKCSSKAEDTTKESWEKRSELCLLKVYGIKTLVKSYLPVKDAQLRPGIDELVEILRSILLFGEISKDVESSSVDKAHLRFASAKAVLRLSKQWDHKIPVDIFHLTVMMPETPFPQLRKLFLGKVYHYIKDRLLDAKYACAFLLNKDGIKPLDVDEKQNLADIIQIHYQGKARQVSIQNDTNPSEAYPEYILPYLVHALGHHSCSNVCDDKDVKTYEPLYRQLYLFLSMLLHKDDDVKSESNTSKEKESLSTIVSIFQNIRNSDDQVDVEKSKNSHFIAELGLSIIKRLVQRMDDLHQSALLVSLPSILYKQHEKKDDDVEANEGKTWLADGSFLAHFESLKFDSGGAAIPEIMEDGVLKDSETEANEVPLGKIIKQLKSGSKGAKVKKDKFSPAKGKNAESGVDILKMVREINLDSLGLSSKFESSNGHNHFSREGSREQQKEKTRNASDLSFLAVPKKRRSAYSASRLLQKTSRTFVASGGDASHYRKDMKPAPNLNDASTGNDVLVSSLKKGINTEPKKRIRNSDLDNRDKAAAVGKADNEGLVIAISSVPRHTDSIITTNVLKSPTGTMKKRKRSIAGLTKCTTKDTDVDVEELTGHRIKVWWPMDKQFYEGTVKSYDPLKRKHVILYDDGDIEVLNLERERWELLDGGGKQSKKLKSSNRLTSTEMFQLKKNSNFSSSWQNNKSAMTIKGKGTPKKKKDVRGEPEEKEVSSMTKSETSEASIGSAGKSGDAHEEQAEPRKEDARDGEESGKEVMSSPRGEHPEDEEKSPVRSDNSDGEANSDDNSKVPKETAKEEHGSEEKEVDKSDESLREETNKRKSDSEENQQADDVKTADKGLMKTKKAKEKPVKRTNEEAEISDDETTKPKKAKKNLVKPTDEAGISDDEPLLKWKKKAVKLKKAIEVKKL